MNPLAPLDTSRRRFLAQSGAIVVAFAIAPSAYAQGAPGSLNATPNLDSWIGVGADGTITVFTGKVELGQGSRPRCCRSHRMSCASILHASRW